MKNLLKISFVVILTTASALFSTAQSRTELCRGSGYHCMEVDYGGIIAKFVKGKGQPGAVIIDEEKSIKS